MTTQGGLSYGDLIRMEDADLMGWYQKCVDYNEEMEEKMPKGRSR